MSTSNEELAIACVAYTTEYVQKLVEAGDRKSLEKFLGRLKLCLGYNRRSLTFTYGAARERIQIFAEDFGAPWGRR